MIVGTSRVWCFGVWGSTRSDVALGLVYMPLPSPNDRGSRKSKLAPMVLRAWEALGVKGMVWIGAAPQDPNKKQGLPKHSLNLNLKPVQPFRFSTKILHGLWGFRSYGFGDYEVGDLEIYGSGDGQN